jgi:hypothetical protein
MTQFTLEDLNKLIQLCDIATKAGGLQIAQEALPLAAKIQQISQEMQRNLKTFSEAAE